MTQNSTNLNLKNENKLIQESCMLENRASLTTDSLQLTAYGLQPTAHNSQLAAHNSSLTTHRPQLTAYGLQGYSKSKIQNPKSKISSHLLTFSPSHRSWRLLLANCFLILVMMLGMGISLGQTPETKNSGYLTSGSSFTLPQGTYKVTKLEAWGGGGGGGKADSYKVAGGGGGGGYAIISINVSAHKDQSISYSAAQQVGECVHGDSSTVSFGGYYISAYGGAGVSKNSTSGGNYGSFGGSTGVTGKHGGKGGNGFYSTNNCNRGGGGGGGAGSTGNGSNGGTPTDCGLYCIEGGGGGNGGSGDGGGAGGKGGTHSSGNYGADGGNAYGGGGGGARSKGSGGSGAGGAVRITYQTLKLNVTFNKNTTETVTGMPSSTTIDYYEKYSTNTSIVISNSSNYPKRAGYTFAGWCFDTACTQAVTGTDNCTKEQNFTLYAKWTPNTITFTLDPNATDASITTNTLSKVYRETFTASDFTTSRTPSRTGYRFTCWTTNANGTGDTVKAGKVNIYPANRTLYAQWAACNVTVTFQGEGGTFSGNAQTTTRTYTYDQNFGTFPTSPTRHGYDFVCWTTNGGTTVSTSTKCKKTNELPITWQNEGNGWPGGTNCTPMTLTLKAKWVEHTYTITLHAGDDGYFDGNTSKKTKTVKITYNQTYGQMIPADNADHSNWTSRYGVSSSTKSFDGWFAGTETAPDYTANSEKKETTSFVDNETQVQHLWVRWGTSCKVYANGGTLTSLCDGKIEVNDAGEGDYKFTVYSGQPVNTKLNGCNDLTTNISRVGYTFDDWYWNGVYTSANKVNFNANYTSGSIYANWNPRQVEVSFEGNQPGTTTPSNVPQGIITVSFDSEFTVLENLIPTCVGYIFAGWWTEASGGMQINEDNICNKATLGNKLSLPSTGNGSLTLYAHWTPRQVEVSFEGNQPGTTIPSNVPQGITVSFDAQFGASLGNLADPTCEGYTFKGWYTEEITGKLVKSDSVCNKKTFGNKLNLPSTGNGSLTLYAHWEARDVEVTFNGNNGTPTTQTKTFKYDKKFNANNVTWPSAERSGYTFAGWFKATSGNDEVTAADYCNQLVGVSFASDSGKLTLYAHWTVRDVTVKFNINKPSEASETPSPLTVNDLTFHYDATYTGFTTPTLEGWTFDGWYTAEGTKIVPGTTKCNQSEINFQNATSNGVITLYAHWTARKVTVSFDAAGGTVSPTSKVYTFDKAYNYGSDSLPTPSRTGYDFDDWYTAASGGTKIINTTLCNKQNQQSVNTSGTGNCTLTLFAHWTAKKYRCAIYNDYTDNPCGSNPFEVTFDKKISSICNLNNLHKNGYTLSRLVWDDDSQVDINEKWTWPYDRTIYPEWTVSRFNITLDATNGGTASNVTLSGGTNGKYVINDVAYYGVTLTSQAIDLGFITIHIPKIDEEKPNVYGVYQGTYSNGNVYVCTDWVSTNGNISNHTPSRTGYTFDYWYYPNENKNPKTHVNDNTKLLADVAHTLYAHWTGNNRTITLNLNGGTLSQNCSTCVTNNKFQVIYGSPMNVNLTNGCDLSATKIGYTFTGWYMQSSDTPLNLSGDWLVDDNITIYAHWKEDTVIVTFDPQGGTITPASDASKRVTYTQQYGTLPVPTREGYVFRGWFFTQNGTGNEVFATTTCDQSSIQWNNHKGSITLYAKWEKKIIASLSQDSVSCYGYSDGKVIVSNIQGGSGNYTVTITKGNVSYSTTLTNSGNGASHTFGTNSAEPISAGEWTVNIKDANHVNYSGTGLHRCDFSNTVTVKEPAALSFTTAVTDQTCSAQGKVMVNVSGGTKPYHVDWTGSTGAASQAGHRDFSTSSTTISNLTYQNVLLHVTDAHNCPVDDQTVTIHEATNELSTINTININACSGNEFSYVPSSPTDGTNIPSSTRYSWTAPDGSGAVSGNMESSIHGVITTTTTQTYVYYVTPALGPNCMGDEFEVRVTVNGSTSGTVTTITSPWLESEPEGCANSTQTLSATFNNPVYQVSYTLNGVTQTASYPNGTNTFSADITMPDMCNGDPAFTIKVEDANHCQISASGQVHVHIANWSAPALNDPAPVTCISAAVAPTTFPTATDGCHNSLDEPTLLGVTYSTDNGSSWGSEPFACSGLVRYTYRYTACDNSYHDWTYTYTVTGNTDAPMVSNPITTKAADVDNEHCLFKVPDLTGIFRANITGNSCTLPADMLISQQPEAGTYITENTSVMVTLTDSCDKHSEYTVNITVPTRPVASISNEAIACYNGTTSATVNVTEGTGTAPFTYLWDDASAQHGATATNLHAGSYMATVTDANNCVTYAFVTITQPTALQASISVTNSELCEGGSTAVYATVSGGTSPYTTYTWNNGIGNVPTTMVTLTQDTTYTLTVTDSKGCTATATPKKINVNPLPAVQISKEPNVSTICAGSAVTLTASADNISGNVDYTWKNSSGTTIGNGPTIVVRDAGSYTVTATATGCSNTSAPVSLNVDNPYITLQPISTQNVCSGGSLTLTANTSNYNTEGNNTWEWFTVSGNTATLIPDSVNNHLTVRNITADAVYKVVGTNKVGNCTKTDTLNVNIHVVLPVVVLNEFAENPSICPGASVELTAPVNNAQTVADQLGYAWSPVSGLNYTDRYTVEASPATTTTYTVTVTAYLGGCTTTASQSVTVNVRPAFNAGSIVSRQDIICKGGSVEKIANQQAATGGGDDNSTVVYQWLCNDVVIADSTRAEFVPGTSYTDRPGTYIFTRKAMNTTCMVDDYELSVGSYTLTVQAPITLYFMNELTQRNQSVCSGNEITPIGISYSNATIDFSWQDANQNTNPTEVYSYMLGNSLHAVITLPANVTAPVAYTYTVTAIADGAHNQCTVEPLTGVITVNPAVVLTANTGLNIAVCEGVEIANAVSMSYANASAPTIAWLWYDENDQQMTSAPSGVNFTVDANQQKATIGGTPTVAGSYTYTVTAASATCASQSLTGTLTVNPLVTLTASVADTTQTLCFGGSIRDIAVTHTHSTVTVTGLPYGVEYSETYHKISGTPNSAGVYHYTITAQSDFDCAPQSVTGTITVTPVVSLTAASNLNVITCANAEQNMDAITINYANASTTPNIAWYDVNNQPLDAAPDGIGFAVDAEQHRATISGRPTVAGSYTYVVTATGCTPQTLTGTVTVNPQPELIILSGNVDTAVCAGNPIRTIEISYPYSTLETPNISSYGLVFGNNTNSKQASIYNNYEYPYPTSTAIFNLTASNSCGAKTIPVSITVSPKPTIVVTNDNQTLCTGSSLTTISVTTGNAGTPTIQWYKNEQPTTQPAGISYNTEGTVLAIILKVQL